MNVVDVWHQAFCKTLYGNFKLTCLKCCLCLSCSVVAISSYFDNFKSLGFSPRNLKSSKLLEIATTKQERHKQHFRQVVVPLFHYLQ